MRRLAILALLCVAVSTAHADWPASGKYVGLALDSFNGSYGARFLELPGGDLDVLMIGVGGNAFGYSMQRISRGGDFAPGWPTNGFPIGEWGKSFQPFQHGFVVDDSGCVWHAAPATSPGGYSQLIRPEPSILPQPFGMWTTFGSMGTGFPAAAAPAPGGAYILASSRAQRMTRAGIPAAGWPANGIATVTGTTVFNVSGQPDGAGGAVVFAPSFSGPLAQRIDGNATVHAGWPASGLLLSNDPGDLLADFAFVLVDPLLPSGSDGFIAAWATPYNSGFKRIRLQRFRLDGSIDPAWPAGAVTAAASDSMRGVTLIPDGVGGAHVLWYSLTSQTIRGTHVLANGQFAPGLGPDGVALPAPGSRPRFPKRTFQPSIEFVVADAAPNGGLVFAWNDTALAPTPSIRVRWLLSDYTADPNEPAEGRLILPSGSPTDLRGLHADGVGGAFVAWEVIPPDAPPNSDLGQIWMTRILPSSLVGAPAAPHVGGLALSPPRPNPARGVVAFDVTLPDDSPAAIELLDVAGRVVLTQRVAGAGPHTVGLAGGSLAPGLYFVRLSHRAGTRATRAVLTR